MKKSQVKDNENLAIEGNPDSVNSKDEYGANVDRKSYKQLILISKQIYSLVHDSSTIVI